MGSVMKNWSQNIFESYTSYNIEPVQEISNNVVCGTSKASDQPVHKHSLIRAFSSRLSILWLLSYWLNTIWSFYASKEAAQARLSLHMSKCHIVGNHMPPLIYYLQHSSFSQTLEFFTYIQFHILHSLNKFRWNIQRRVNCVYQN